jgi:hypothetical protein
LPVSANIHSTRSGFFGFLPGFGFWPFPLLSISEACPYAFASLSASLQSLWTFDLLLCGFYQYCETLTFWTFTCGFCSFRLLPYFAFSSSFGMLLSQLSPVPSDSFSVLRLCFKFRFDPFLSALSARFCFSAAPRFLLASPVARFCQHPFDSFRFLRLPARLRLLALPRILSAKFRFRFPLPAADYLRPLLFQATARPSSASDEIFSILTAASSSSGFDAFTLGSLFHPTQLLASPDL